VTFEEHDAKTKLTLQAKVSGFTEITRMMVGGFEAGWTQSLEKFEALVASLRRE
jgi:Activator of Hsp90 ATPase homolog 1-like protein